MVIGIDLGTTCSAAACLAEDGIPKILNNSEGGNTTPSVVLFDGDKQVIVGEVARDNAVIRPRDAVAAVKNFMGKKKVYKPSCGVSYTPEMISSFILRKLVLDSAAALGEEVSGAVVTVPAYYTDAQRKATEDAAAMAGINLLGLLNEPTAAALCYTSGSHIRNENLLVYDLGGGTFDVTILAIDGDGIINVRSTGGLSNAGGRFFDESLVAGIVRLMEEKHGIDLEDDDYLDELQELFAKVEQAKRQLSSRETATVHLKIDKVREQIIITRQQLEEIVEKTYRRTEGKMKRDLVISWKRRKKGSGGLRMIWENAMPPANPGCRRTIKRRFSGIEKRQIRLNMMVWYHIGLKTIWGFCMTKEPECHRIISRRRNCF